MNEPVLRVEGLKTSFSTDSGEIPVVRGIDFAIRQKEILGIVGESGCGKSITSLSIMRLLPEPLARIEGNIYFKGENLIKLPERQMCHIRGNDIAMIFQEPMTSLNPVFTIGDQLTEAVRIHNKTTKRKAADKAVKILEEVGLPRAKQIMKEYPHQLSGGMRQRVMIAMAMICEPELLIADEPTTALDVTIQAQILELMRKLNNEKGTSIMLITHDLGVVAEMCERVLVMYAGKIVEEAPVLSLFQDPKHPYTAGLLKSVPDLRSRKERLYSIPGNVPRPGTIKTGCEFAPRCPHAFERCLENAPELLPVTKEQKVRCWLYQTDREETANDHALA
ncbi:MAG TPA: ABC transporter ATP-binding protein [Bacillaceae bacterium]